MADKIRFSVVIPCFNEAGYVADALLSLQKQDFDGGGPGGGFEVIVVDNNCTDDTAQIARDLGARVVTEPEPGVCNARQRGTLEARGEIVVSADADTVYSRDWLSRIDAAFRASDDIVAVVGPCEYADGPRWGRTYGRALFGAVNGVYKLTGRAMYASATNIAFRRDAFTGYDTNLTQGGDELDQLRRLRKRGRVVYAHANPTFTSGRRFTRGLGYNVFVSLPVHYLLTYGVNRIAGRRVLGSAPAFRLPSALSGTSPAVSPVSSLASPALSAASPASLAVSGITSPSRAAMPRYPGYRDDLDPIQGDDLDPGRDDLEPARSDGLEVVR
ncbi:MAG: glycosyltransferase family 2 protein [Hamadaea sp.]|uniref:glycosyltransferase n=1 Tax=Hamadaea sp. TaxID=2024425 RepID=UPI0017F3CCB2|nr:glycosyltransferase family A protein [Hamadaea sp.]NUT22757.1 glycosyltransferase family 2 protein [Hamadaea sp.]